MECYIDITVNQTERRISIQHDDRPCDAKISVDGNEVETRVRMMPKNGGALFFDVDGKNVIVAISSQLSGDGWDYDCFVDGYSVVNGMPWTLGKLDLPAVLKWERERRSGKNSYFLLCCAKGALIGCGIFLVIFLISLFSNIKISWVHPIICLLPLIALYAAFAPSEWKKNEQAYQEYLSYRTKEAPVQAQTMTEEAAPQQTQTASDGTEMASDSAEQQNQPAEGSEQE